MKGCALKFPHPAAAAGAAFAAGFEFHDLAGADPEEEVVGLLFQDLTAVIKLEQDHMKINLRVRMIVVSNET